jgi:hypothetical protein
MITENEQDELIFDFLEGNLSHDEEEAFLMLKEESELFNRQVRLWQNTYLEEPLPSVELLERKLMIEPVRHTVNFSSRIYMILMIMMTYATLPGDGVEKYIPDTITSVTHDNIPVPYEATDQVSKIIFDCAEAGSTAGNRTVETQAEVSTKNHRPIDQSAVLSKPNLEALFKTEQVTLEEIEVRKDKTQKQASSVAKKKWSRREKRLIRQKLWQDNHTRKANEFLKGNVPYVVPLNSNNF